MHQISSTPATVAVIFFFFFIFFSVHVTISFSLSGCDDTFTCGPLHNLSYPFTGGERPAHCGPPEFRLSCDGGETPEITISSLSYRVLRVDSLRRTLSVARSDLSNDTCPRELVNTTMDSRYFTYGAGNTDLTMFYRCNTSLPDIEPANRFWCGNQGWSRNDSYFLVGQVPFDPVLQIVECDGSVEVPILNSIAVNLTNNRSLLAEALMLGFNVNYTFPFFDECSKCLAFGRQCGFDSNLSKPICICGDQVCSVPGRIVFNGKQIIFIGIGAAVLGIAVFSVVIICYYKREYISTTRIAFWKTATRDQEFDVNAFIRNFESFAPKRYSYAAVKRMTNSFSEKIGKGGYGAVNKGKLPDGLPMAVKVLHESKTSDGEEFINEVASIGRTSHVNIVTLLGFCCEKKKRALVYEYMPNGSLDKFIFNRESFNADCRLEWKTLFDIAVGIARGLEYLHQGCNTRILHFDIKPQNILLDKDFCPKISYFGLAKLWLTKESIVSMAGARGTIGYIAPEVFSRAYGGVSHKSDVYSYGMLILEMVGGRKNFDSAASHTSEIYFPNRIFKDIEMGNEASLLGNITEEEKEISRKIILVSFWCIQTNPVNRPSMSKVVDMLEGSLESSEFPPKPYLFSPTRSPE